MSISMIVAWMETLALTETNEVDASGLYMWMRVHWTNIQDHLYIVAMQNEHEGMIYMLFNVILTSCNVLSLLFSILNSPSPPLPWGIN